MGFNSEVSQSKTDVVIRDFIEAINKQNITQIVMTLSESTIFCNSQGKEITGKENVLRAWMKYFELFPDYTIEVDQTIHNAHTIVILGHAKGSYKNSQKETDQWKLPSAWKATIENEKVALWQVYTDNMVPFEIIKRNMNGNRF